MAELFRTRIASKRLMAVPQRLMALLHLSEGDGFEILVNDDRTLSVTPCKTIPLSFLTEEQSRLLKEREERLISGEPINRILIAERKRATSSRKAAPNKRTLTAGGH
jgi:antitoxin component of MazEF toxin-antitoxin module